MRPTEKRKEDLELPRLPSGPRRFGAMAALACLIAVGLLPARSAAESPRYKGNRIVTPGERVRSGSVVRFLAFYDSTQYAVTADFSALDPTATTPVAGTYIGDSTLVNTLTAWPCYAFDARISPADPRPDASGIVVPLTATNPRTGESVTNSVVQFCLSNHPPRHLRTRILGDPERFSVVGLDTLYTLRNGDSLRLETTWRFRNIPFSTRADFSALDDSFAPERVYYALAAAPSDSEQTHAIWYELNRHAKGVSEATLPLTLRGEDGGCGRDSTTLFVRLDNQPPAGQPIFRGVPAQVTAPPLAIHGVAPAGSHDLLVVLNFTTEIVLPLIPVGDSLVFQGTIQLQPGANHLVGYARDLVGNRSLPSLAHAVTLLNVPQFKRWVVLAPDSASSEASRVVHLRNGDPVRLRTYWDSRVAYDVWADFQALDSEAGPPVLGVPCGDLTVDVGGVPETWYGYQFEHTISAANTRADDDAVVVPVTARDPGTGFETRSESLTFCLDNHPPQHLWTRVIGDSSRFVAHDGDTLFVVRNGGSIYLQTSWYSPNRPLTVRADFSRVDKDFLDWYVQRWLIDSLSTPTVATYGITYDFSTEACCREGQAPYPLPVRITVTDTGCGLDSISVLLEMDNQGPAGSPLFQPVPPRDAVAGSVPIHGTAPEGSFDLLARIEHLDADSTDSVVLPIDEARRFSGSVPLLPGANRLTAYGRDGIGNLSSPSTAYEIERVTEEWAVTVPQPVRPGDTILLESRRGWSRVSAAIFTLQGDRVRLWEQQGTPLLYRVDLVWDGLNGGGRMVAPGPFLLRVRATDATGSAREEVKALVFQR
jgi:hypothetical protein